VVSVFRCTGCLRPCNSCAQRTQYNQSMLTAHACLASAPQAPGRPPRASAVCSGLDACQAPAPATTDTPTDGGSAPSTLDQVTLGKAIDAVIAKTPALQSASWGFVVADDQGKVLYQKQADAPLLPASSLKLVTGAAAIHQLGAQARFTTSLVTNGTLDTQGTLHGDLYLVGGGDPSLQTQDLEQAITASGLKKVEGHIFVDDHCFDQVRRGRGWAPDDVSAPYAAECDGLSLDHNVTGLDVSSRGIFEVPNLGYLEFHNLTTPGPTTDVSVERQADSNLVEVSGTVSAAHASSKVTVHEPALYAGTVLASLLGSQGGAVSDSVSAAPAPAHAQVLWQHQSPTVRELETTMLKESDNLYAETLFHALANGDSAQAPELEKQLLHLGAGTTITDGCGLSRDDRVSPSQLLDVVRHEYISADAQACLTISGVDGTLKNRMLSLRGRVHAKTGTLGDVSTLAGWLSLGNGHALSFAWMANGFAGPAHDIKATEDKLVETLAAAADGEASTGQPG
jgi:serine-type D-Ala-D-Ala carboxypeptidase/endopeptidase (penicillin-binding protein 4)